jgi:hypothetical protein
LFQALNDSAGAPPSEDWICLARAGRNGEDGKSLAIRGTWNAETKYQQLDIVALGGSSFIAKKDEPGACPDSGDWQLLAALGKTGIKGPPAEKGERGERGERGPAGEPAPVIVAWRVDRKSYAVQPVMSDGSEVLPINMRELFEQYTDESR